MTAQPKTLSTDPLTTTPLPTQEKGSKFTGVSIQDVNALIGCVTKAIGDLYAAPKSKSTP